MQKRKKLFSWILTAVMTLSLLTAFPITANAEPLSSFWTDGITSTDQYPFGGGDGSSADSTFEISTLEQLVQLAYNVNSGTNYSGKFFLLKSNIVLSGKQWMPIGRTYGTAFNGSFDGNGHYISGLTMTEVSGADAYGLFGNLGIDGVIEGIAVESGNITFSERAGNGYFGGIVGHSLGLIKDCSNKADITISNTEWTYAGGIVGLGNSDTNNYTWSARISRCRNEGNIQIGRLGSVGGIIGNQLNSTASTVIDLCSNSGMITGGSNAEAGGIAGRVDNASTLGVINCFNTGNVTSGDGTSNSVYAGGIVGYEYYSQVKNCYNTGDIKLLYSSLGNTFCGGISGHADIAAVNCYNVGTITGTGTSGEGINGAVIECVNCYYLSTSTPSDSITGITSLTAAQMKNHISFINWDFPNIWTINNSDNNGYPALAWQGFEHKPEIEEETGADICIVPGCATSIADGGFTEFTVIGDEKYYHVSTAAQLAHINEHLNLNYIQTADIDLSQYDNGLWTPIGGFGDPEYFTGKYLGNGYSIKNLSINFNNPGQNAVYAGVFAAIQGADASVSGLTVTVTGVNITAYNYSYFGAVAGELYGGSISNCHAIYLGDVDTKNTPNGYHGGIVGMAYSIWDNEAQQYNNNVIDGCTATFESGSLLADGWSKYAGGIVGRSDTKIINCDVIIAENEMIRSANVGGIAGMMYSKIIGNALENCAVSGEGILALSPQHYYSYYIGGLVGRFTEGSIRNCTNGVFIDASGATMLNDGEQVYAGGLVGYLGTRSDLFGCSNTGNVSIVVANNIVDNYGEPGMAEGDEYAYAGGIAGYIYGYSNKVTIENCENNADVSSVNQIPGMRAYAGGLAGHVDSDDGDYAGVKIINCANLGTDTEVYAQAGTTMTGGLLGSTTYHDFINPNISLSNSYNRASVKGESNSAPANNGTCVGITAGGTIGAVGEITISNTYSTAVVNAISTHGADAYEGGIFGVLYMTTATQNYYEKNADVTKAVGGKVSGMDVVATDDLVGSYEGATATQLKTKTYYGDDWVWYVSGGTAPDYYSSDPWRFTKADSYPVLKGLPYTASTPPNSGGSHTPSKYQISAAANTGGTITPSGNSIVKEYGNITFTIKPDKGYIVKDVLVDGVSIGAVTTYTFSSVKANHMIEAKFAHDCPSKPFTDVDITQWYHDGIDYALLAGLFKGTSETTFAPNAGMTRAMLVTVLHRLEGTPSTTTGNPFTDVDSGNWYTEAIVWANAKGIVKGYDSDTFGTNNFITREQLAAILYRYAQYKEYDVSVGEDTNILSYEDALYISEYAIPAVQWACGADIMQGDGAKLDPQGNATRAQVAAMLMRFIENVVK